jgi:Spy/CpxP family protein refolding chaperone
MRARFPPRRKGDEPWTYRSTHAAEAVGAASLIALGPGVLEPPVSPGPPASHNAFGRLPPAMRERVEFGVHRALNRVNGTQAQEDQVLAIVDGLFAKHGQMAGEREQFHQRIAAALTGTTVDRAALEAIRVEAIQHMDLASKDLVKAVADIAEVLTPAQRQQLAELHKSHFGDREEDGGARRGAAARPGAERECEGADYRRRPQADRNAGGVPSPPRHRGRNRRRSRARPRAARPRRLRRRDPRRDVARPRRVRGLPQAALNLGRAGTDAHGAR